MLLVTALAVSMFTIARLTDISLFHRELTRNLGLRAPMELEHVFGLSLKAWKITPIVRVERILHG